MTAVEEVQDTMALRARQLFLREKVRELEATFNRIKQASLGRASQFEYEGHAIGPMQPYGIEALRTLREKILPLRQELEEVGEAIHNSPEEVEGRRQEEEKRARFERGRQAEGNFIRQIEEVQI